MNKLFLSLCFIVLTSSFGLSQSSDDYNKNEFYVGYSNQQVYQNPRNTFNGFEVSYTRNFHRYFGAKTSVSAAFKRGRFSSQNNIVEERRSIYNYLGGVQLKDNASDKKFQPFGHLLVGVANVRNQTLCPTCAPLIRNNKFSGSGLAGAIGGGIDIKLSEKINLRAIQVDYNMNRANNERMKNVRFGIGIVFK